MASVAEETFEPSSNVADLTLAFKSKDKLHRTPERAAAAVEQADSEGEYRPAVRDSPLHAPQYDDSDAFDVFGGIKSAESEVLPAYTPERPASPIDLLNQSLGLDDIDDIDDIDENGEAQPIFVHNESGDAFDHDDETDAPEPVFVPTLDEPDDNWLDQEGILTPNVVCIYPPTLVIRISGDHDILLPSTPAVPASMASMIAPSRVFSSGFASPSKSKGPFDDKQDINVGCCFCVITGISLVRYTMNPWASSQMPIFLSELQG